MMRQDTLIKELTFPLLCWFWVCALAMVFVTVFRILEKKKNIIKKCLDTLGQLNGDLLNKTRSNNQFK